MAEKILIDKKTLKALTVDTRMNILKLLSRKQYTLTEIADELGLKNSTVKEHLDILLGSTLIKKEDTDRKWKYYSLTLKGRRIIEPREVKVLFAFIITAIGALILGVALLTMFTGIGSTYQSKMMADAPAMDTLDMMDEADKGEEADNELMLARAAVHEPPPEPIVEEDSAVKPSLYIAFTIFLSTCLFLLGFYLKKKPLIIQKGDKR